MSEKLLPCPFCGSDQLVVKPNAFDGLLRVQCEGCWATSVTSNQKKVAVAAWNTRVGVAPTPNDTADLAQAFAWARNRLEKFADDANAGLVHYSPRELKRKVWGAFADADAILAGKMSLPSTASSDKVRPDAEWLTAKHAEFDNIFATTPTSSAATTVEPVGWQARGKVAGTQRFWHHCDIPNSNQDYEFRPVYATPPSSGNADAVRVALAEWVAVRQDLNGMALLGKEKDETDEQRKVREAKWTRLGNAEHALMKVALSSAPVAGEWREALKPLAGLYEQIDDRDADPNTDVFFQHDGTKITFGDIRRARALLSRNDRGEVKS